MSHRYVLAWNLEAKRVLVVGGGTIGEGKVETLRGTGAAITVVGPSLTPRLRELLGAGELSWRQRMFRWSDARKCRLVIAATDCEQSNVKVAKWARRFGALVNVVDDPSKCDVIVPATVRRGPATISITTNGATPAGARFLRETIEGSVPVAFGDVLTAGSIARHDLRESGHYRYDYPAWKQHLFGPALEMARAGRPVSIAHLRHQFVDSFAAQIKPKAGHVTLVGAGPGGRGLITVAGAEALAVCDVVVYDRLADPELLSLAPVVAERIPVGKSKGRGVGQDEINRILVQKASEGFDVVRLKGGDPLLFGRGIEETDALGAAGISSTIIPGVSSAFAAPGLAGIPVTRRDIAASVTVISGHRAADDNYDWSALARVSGTIVVMMGASKAAGVADRLIAAGRCADELVAVCHRAGTERSATAQLTLAELSRDGCPFPAPSVIVIGAVAAYASVDGDPGAMVGDRVRRALQYA